MNKEKLKFLDYVYLVFCTINPGIFFAFLLFDREDTVKWFKKIIG